MAGMQSSRNLALNRAIRECSRRLNLPPANRANKSRPAPLVETTPILSPDFEKRASPTLLSQLAAIVEFSNDAIFSRTCDGTITTWNAAAERIFGYEAREIINQSSDTLVPPGRHDEFHKLLASIQRGKVVQHFETERLRKDGRRIQVSLTLSPVFDSANRLIGFSTIARDVTEQRQVRQALARRERELESLFEQASVGLVVVGCDGDILRANRALFHLLECPAEKILGLPFKAFQADGALFDDSMDRLAQRQTLHNVPIQFRTAKGRTRFALVDANALWEDGKMVHSRWVVRDISRRKELERELLEISERERRQFAQELHDGLGQQLGGVAYLSNVLRERLEEHRAPETAEAARIYALVRSAIEQTRRVARGLSPIPDGPDGLMRALSELASQTAELFGVRCRFDCRKPVWVADSGLAAHFYRISQEAVSNALKHARPRAVTIRLRQERDRIALAILDNGRGIGSLSPSREGLGLRIMKYRADLVRGNVVVRPRRRGGTEVVCTAPWSGNGKPKTGD